MKKTPPFGSNVLKSHSRPTEEQLVKCFVFESHLHVIIKDNKLQKKQFCWTRISLEMFHLQSSKLKE